MRNRLVINGGSRAVPEGLEIPRWPVVTKKDIFAIMRMVEREEFWGFSAKEVMTLEKEYSEYVGVDYCLALDSGTAALHAAVAAVGVGPGDEVLVPALTFVSSATSVLHNQGIPVFVDVDPDTFNMDPTKIEEKISKKTKVIMPVHFQGLPADMDKINTVAKKYNLVVIEDGSQAHGALYKGKKTGSLGGLCGASIMPGKNLPGGGEGGLLTTNNSDYCERARMIRVFGEITGEDVRSYNARNLGWNYRMSSLCAAMARSQLTRLDEYTKLRQSAAEYFSGGLREIPGFEPPYVPSDRTHVYHIYRFKVNAEKAGINVDNGRFRKALQDILSKEGVPVAYYQTNPIPGQTLFQEKIGYGKGCPWTCPHARQVKYDIYGYPQTLKVIEETLTFGGLHPLVSRKALDSYLCAFRKVFDNLSSVGNHAKKLDYQTPWEEAKGSIW